MDKFIIPERNEISAEFQWKLTDIYATDTNWESDIDAVKKQMPQIQSKKGQITQSAHLLWTALDLRSKINQTLEKLFAYARMHRDENAASPVYQAMTNKIQALEAEASAAYAFMEPEILTLPTKTLENFLREEQRLEEYRFYLENLTKQKKHILSAQEEALLSAFGDVAQASAETFQMLARADITFPAVYDTSKQELPLSEGRYHSFMISPDRQVRQQAFKNLLGTYKNYRNTFASTLRGNIKKDIFYAKTRHYSSHLAASLEPDEIPLSFYDQLIATVHKHLPAMERYVSLKKKILNVPELHMYDMYAPLTNQIRLAYSYEEAVKLVKQALAPLGKEYLADLSTGLASGWVDVYENKGKQTGAYSWGVYGVHPFVLLNFDGKYNDVSTLAHELGHAMHSYYSQKKQPYPTSSYTIFCAEVASTTNEILLIDHVLATTADRSIQAYLLNQYLESIRTTVYRQTMFAEFEQKVYMLAETGESLTAELFENLWRELNAKYYGPELVIDDSLVSEWSRIPHFYRSFYVYKYATGYSAATAFANHLSTDEKTAQKQYLNFLSSGGSDYSLNLLKAGGVDLASGKPIEQTLVKFSQLLDKLEALL
ncbi:MAG: oligoendopeptidase F [Sporomusaceae bacterium]|nr:oligoendopeptidase F [Sporomusaceae bacterium]